MKTYFTFLFSFLFAISTNFAQQKGPINFNPDLQIAVSPSPQADYTAFFAEAYQSFPTIPRGVLEGVAFNNTSIWHVPENIQQSCAGIPQAHGVMGLIENGKGFFRENLTYISNLTGYSAEQIKADPRVNILAYAKAFEISLTNANTTNVGIAEIAQVLEQLSELAYINPVENYGMSSFQYNVFNFMNSAANQAKYSFPDPQLNLVSYFGQNNYSILSSSFVNINGNKIQSHDGTSWQNQVKSMMCNQVPGAIWNAAHSSNFSVGRSQAVSAVTVHKIQGPYSSAINWFKNSVANVSAHYIVRASDGQITQMVCEGNTAWHVGSSNGFTVGIENDGYVENNDNTTALYQANALITKDVAAQYGINRLRTWGYQGCTGGAGTCQLGACTFVKGHQHYPNQSHSDPGIYWNWRYFYKLVNDDTPVTNYTAASGTFYDTGGAGGNYADDSRKIYKIAPTNATDITITINSFNLELNWDYLLVYDGPSVFSPLVGEYTGTTIPSTFTASGSALTVEFRSDCGTTNPGYSISWGSVGADNVPPTTTVSSNGTWETNNFTANFSDSDNSGGSGIAHRFYQVIHYTGSEWRSNGNRGYLKDNFDNTIHSDWGSYAGSWSISGGNLVQSDEANGNTILSAPVNQNGATAYLYDWSAAIGGSGTNRRAGIHFMCSDPDAPNRGNSYFVYYRVDNSLVQIYSVTNDVFTLEKDIPITVNLNQTYNNKIIYNKSTGKITIYRDGNKIGDWTDPTPLTTGSHVSLRTGNCTYTVNQINVYAKRTGTTKTITVGTGANDDIQFQNPNPTAPSGKVKSILIDGAGNFSTIGEKLINVDWTTPTLIIAVQDGTGADIDITTSTNSLSANWSASSDPHSGINYYQYAIGTTPGGTNVTGWTSTGTTRSMTKSGLNLVSGLTYYVTVRTYNNAGLVANAVESDGVQIIRDIAVSPRVFLGGSYNSTSNVMIDYLRVAGLVPTNQPYSNTPWNYSGTESTTAAVLNVAGSNAIIDWVLVQLRDKNDPSTVLDTQAALLQSDSDIVGVDGISPVEFSNLNEDDYYVTIIHRNHLAIMSAAPVSLSTATTVVDFRTTPTYGTDAQQQVGSLKAMWSGDTNGDGFIDAGDRSLAWNSRNTSGYSSIDCNLDGIIDAADRSTAWNNRNKTAQLP